MGIAEGASSYAAATGKTGEGGDGWVRRGGAEEAADADTTSRVELAFGTAELPREEAKDTPSRLSEKLGGTVAALVAALLLTVALDPARVCDDSSFLFPRTISLCATIAPPLWCVGGATTGGRAGVVTIL